MYRKLWNLWDISKVTAILAIIALTSIAPSARAQQGEDPLRVGWTAAGTPQFHGVQDGIPRGFTPDLARLLAEEIGLGVDLIEYDSLHDIADAQKAGQTDILAGALKRPFFDPEMVYSDPVGQGRIQRFAVIDRWPAERDPNAARGLRLALFPRFRGPLFEASIAENEAVWFETLDETLTALLKGEVDIVQTSEDIVQDWARETRLDGRIVPVGAPVLEFDRRVLLHPSRAELLDPINAAIARLEADGRLEDLRRKYHVALYDPPPETLIAGVPHLPPYYIVHEDGRLSGYGVDSLRTLARLVGVKVRFEPITVDQMRRGPGSGRYDLLPIFSTEPERFEQMDFTLPIQQSAIVAIMRSGEGDDIRSLEDLAGQRVAATTGTPSERFLRENGVEVTTVTTTPEQLVYGLVDNRFDIAVTGRNLLPNLAAQHGLGDSIEELDWFLSDTQRAVALRFGLGEIRERLNVVIPSYLLSEDHAEILRRYFGPPGFWTPVRLRIGIAAGAVTALGLLGLAIAFLRTVRTRRRERKLSEETLRFMRGLQAVTDAAQSGILGLDRRGRIEIANPLALRLIGLDSLSAPADWPDEIAFQSARDTAPLTGTDHPVHRALSGERFAGELFVMTRAGTAEQRHVRLSSSVVPAEAAPGLCIVLVLDDVTERERNREHMERSRRLSAVGQLTGGVAHDFNNLLAVIMGRQELLRDDITAPELQEHIDASIGAAQRGADLTRSMLAFARRAPLEPRLIDLNAMVSEIHGWIERTLPANIAVETKLAEVAWEIEADPGATESALLNLILNAKAAMPEGGRLEIRTKNVEIGTQDATRVPPGRHVLLSVTDTGLGIPEEDLARVFEPFFTTKEPGQGSGLGLSMIQGFMEQTGGKALVSSVPGTGSTFELYFPTAGAGRTPAPETARADTRATASSRILLAEDNEEVGTVLTASLRRAGYEVTLAHTGEEAQACFEADPHYDLLASDIMMPGKYLGPELARKLRERNPSLPVIFMSGYADDPEATEAPGMGDCRLLKPVSRRDLLAAVDRALGT